MKKKIFWDTFVMALFGVLAAVLAVTYLMYREMYTNMEQEVRTEARFLSEAVRGEGKGYLERLDENGKHNRITLIDPDGTVEYDNAAAASDMSNHLQRPEVQAAMQNGEGSDVRESDTLGEQIFYAAVLLEDGSILRVARTTDSVVGLVMIYIPYIISICIVIAGIAFLLARLLSHEIVEPINNLNLEDPLAQDIYEELSPLVSRIARQNSSIEAAMQSLKEQKEEFSAITEHMSEGLIVVDCCGLVLSINGLAKKVFDVRGDDYQNHNILRLNRSVAMQNVVETALEGHDGEGMFQRNGRTYQLLSNPVYVEEKQRGVIILLLDVTEKEAAERQRREFTANVSHELKTPLQSISGYAEILQNGMVNTEDVPRFSERIYKEAQRLIRLVEDIIQLSQLDEGPASDRKEAVPLRSLAEEVVSRLGQVAEQKEISLSVSGEETVVMGSRQILDEMIYNLCDNGIKYNQPGGHVSVNIALGESGSTVLSVQDDGIGIPEDSQSRVFERFYRVDKSRSKGRGGTGLGLSIVKHGAAFHGAQLKLESTLGEGTKISVIFPVK